MSISQQIKIGLRGYRQATRLIFKRRYAKYLIFPLLLNGLILWLGLDFTIEAAKDLREYVINLLNLEEGAFWGADFLASGVKGLVSTLLYVLFFILFIFFGGYIIVIVLSPVFSFVAERTEKDTNPNYKDYPFGIKQFFKDVLRGIRIALRNVSIETGIMLLVIILGIIPVVGWIGPFFMFFVSAYFFGFSYMDYTLERHRLKVKQSVKLMRKYRWTAITNGAVFSLFLIIPYCGVAISAFAAVWSVIAGSASAAEIIEKEKGSLI